MKKIPVIIFLFALPFQMVGQTGISSKSCDELKLVISSFNSNEFSRVINYNKKTVSLQYATKVTITGFENSSATTAKGLYTFDAYLSGSNTDNNGGLFTELKNFLNSCLPGYESKTAGSLTEYTDKKDKNASRVRIYYYGNNDPIRIEIVKAKG